MLLVVGSFAALADKTSTHTITITNTDQNVTHSYEAYQVFKGNLDNATGKLSDNEWGSGVDAAGLIGALKTATATGLAGVKAAVASVDTSDSAAVAAAAAKVAEEVGKLTASDSANDVDDFASIVALHLSSTKVAFTGTGPYTASVTGDGYYFVKDTTDPTTLSTTTGSDTLSKYMLSVVADVNVTAKGTHLTPDKEILKANGQNYDRVKQDTAAVGDTVTFEVKIKVPNTKKYIDHFVFDMQDKLPVGMTFMGITSVKVANNDVPYTLTVAERNPAGSTTYGEFATYTAPENAAAAVTNDGGEKIKLVFNNFKSNAETNNWIGKDMVITYTAVVNDKADFTPTGNENEVWFDYSNDPNHDYDGDTPGPGEPMGETPHDKTKTLLINLEILKTGDNGTTAALEGAEFEITSDDYNVTLVSGEKFEETGYIAQTGETNQSGTYYKLKVGGYTTTAPTDSTKSMYEDNGTKTYVKVTFANYDVTPGTTKKVTAITGPDGKIVLKGLKPGTYKVKESKAPAGYNLDSTEYTLKVNWTYDANSKTGSFSKDATSNGGFSDIDNTATFKITIDNNSGTTLPSTGGMGTTLFYIGGGILVLAAVILLVTKRRMNAND